MRGPLVLLCICLAACQGPEADVAVLDLVPAADVAEALDGAVACFPGGSGPMGTDDGPSNQSPAHDVDLDAFCLARYEVTNAQYERYVMETGAAAPSYWPVGDEGVLLPVVGVAWDEGAGYCAWAGGRLPTEAQWERACRGIEGRAYPWGDEWDADHVNVTARSVDDAASGAGGESVGGAALQPVGSIPRGATPDGVHDLCGNAAEWVADWHDPDAYRTLPSDNPVAAGPPWNHVVRGGGWYVPTDREEILPELVSCSARDASHAVSNLRIGFRCAFSP